MRRRMFTMGMLQISTMNYAWLRLAARRFPNTYTNSMIPTRFLIHFTPQASINKRSRYQLKELLYSQLLLHLEIKVRDLYMNICCSCIQGIYRVLALCMHHLALLPFVLFQYFCFVVPLHARSECSYSSYRVLPLCMHHLALLPFGQPWWHSSRSPIFLFCCAQA
jgi:hypothetical protein